MRVTYTFGARATKEGTDREIVISEFNNRLLTPDRMEDYLDLELIDAGVVGGEIRGLVTGGRLAVQVTFWFPGHNNSPQLIKRLRDDTAGQLSDGLGECGFECVVGRDTYLIIPKSGAPSVEVTDDGREVSGPPIIAIAARDGKVEALASAIRDNPGDIDKPRQQFTPLHLAVLYGHIEAIRLLLEAGADPNRLEPAGKTPLELCAVSNNLDDDESCIVAQMLLNAGVNPLHTTHGMTARDRAEAIKKARLAAMLGGLT